MTSSRRQRRHDWEYRPVRAYAEGDAWRRGKYGVKAGQFRETSIELCVCRRCGTAVATNTPAVAERVARVEMLDCDELVVRQVMES